MKTEGCPDGRRGSKSMFDRRQRREGLFGGHEVMAAAEEEEERETAR